MEKDDGTGTHSFNPHMYIYVALMMIQVMHYILFQ